MKKAFNILMFQLGWWICVFYGQQKISLFLFVLMILSLFGSHFLLNRSQLRFELANFAIVFTLGVLMDGALIFFDVFQSEGQKIFGFPVWLLGIWFLFPLVLPHSLFWLGKNKILSSVLGAIGGGLAYGSGEWLAVMSFTSQLSLVVVTLLWGAFMPLCFVIINYLKVIFSPATK